MSSATRRRRASKRPRVCRFSVSRSAYALWPPLRLWPSSPARHFNNMGLRRIEWVILRLKTPQSWGLQGAFAFLRDLKFGTTDGWHEHRNVHGGFGIRIRFLVFDRNRQCAESLVIRKHA